MTPQQRRQRVRVMRQRIEALSELWGYEYWQTKSILQARRLSSGRPLWEETDIEYGRTMAQLT